MSKEEEEEEEEERGAEEKEMFGCSTQTTRLELLVIGLGRLFNGDMENLRSFTSLEYKHTRTQTHTHTHTHTHQCKKEGLFYILSQTH